MRTLTDVGNLTLLTAGQVFVVVVFLFPLLQYSRGPLLCWSESGANAMNHPMMPTQSKHTTHMSSSAKGIGITWASCFKVRAVLCVLIIVPTNQTVLPLVLPAFNHKAKVPICNLVGHNYHSHCNNHLQIGSLGTCQTVSVCVGVC